MKQLELKDLVELSDEICEELMKANVGNILAQKMTLKECLHDELLKFAVFLADADDQIEENEIEIICRYLEIKTDGKSLSNMKSRENINDSFIDKVPESLKYAVLADAGHKLDPDPYKGQKAMIFYSRVEWGHCGERDGFGFLRIAGGRAGCAASAADCRGRKTYGGVYLYE